MKDINGNKEYLNNILNQIVTLVSGNKNELKYCCVEEFVLKNGNYYEINNKSFDIRYGEKGDCFKNALNFSMFKGLTYCEGYSLIRSIPMLHAWCVDKDNFVVDPTWDEDMNTGIYFGVKFPSDFVWTIVIKQTVYGILDSYMAGFPCLKGEYDEHIIK